MEIIIDIPQKVYDKVLSGDGTGAIWAGYVKDGTPLDSIIVDIEAARDKDKLCEYPYNRCINIIKKAVGDES